MLNLSLSFRLASQIELILISGLAEKQRNLFWANRDWKSPEASSNLLLWRTRGLPGSDLLCLKAYISTGKRSTYVEGRILRMICIKWADPGHQLSLAPSNGFGCLNRAARPPGKLAKFETVHLGHSTSTKTTIHFRGCLQLMRKSPTDQNDITFS